MNGRSLSRREQIEAEYLRPLPAIRHQMKEQRSATVMRNCYVTFKLHHYSMPKEYIGKRVEIVYDADTLKIYHGLRLVTTHQRMIRFMPIQLRPPQTARTPWEL